MLLLKLVLSRPTAVVKNVDVVVDVVVEVEVGAVKAYRACRKMLTSSLMLMKLVLPRPTALVRKC